MKPVLTADEYNRVDKGFDGDLDVAMDRAGYAVSLAAVRNGAGYGSRALVLAGPGNNGGDGYVAARYLRRRGVAVEVRALGMPRTPQATRAAALATAASIRISPLVAQAEDCDLIVDALFGGGVRGGMPAEIIPWLDAPAPVVAVDYPTGLDPNTGQVQDRAFRCVETVTFQTLKTGHVRGRGPDVCGRVTVTDIGIPGGEPSMWVAEQSDARRPPRGRTAHKWSAGAVLVVGGSPGMIGAAILAGRSALSFGAGSVAVLSPAMDLVNMAAPELLSYPLEVALESLGKFDVVIGGPGLASGDVGPYLGLFAKASRVVLDAGALTREALGAAKENRAEVVVTPHAGEFARLAGVEPGMFAARSLASENEMVVLLKGSPTVVSDGDIPVSVCTGGPELATIGTGDVLSGMLGALMARGLDASSAAVSAAYWHGIAAADLLQNGTVTAEALAGHIGRFAW
ncbi:MAG: NAD(P)H-hydrate dehydratase [Acidimicrobiia bacterium]